ncbi:hypothetical protein W823_20025 [Williamsia sp. D3]|nr:hypothetical protein W823_20025 [Williamsia sp. D3]
MSFWRRVNVYPAEIENALHGIEGLVDLAVIGVRDDRCSANHCRGRSPEKLAKPILRQRFPAVPGEALVVQGIPTQA